MNNNSTYKNLKNDAIKNELVTPSSRFAFVNISPSQVDRLYEILARVLGFSAILGTLVFAAWGIIHPAF